MSPGEEKRIRASLSRSNVGFKWLCGYCAGNKAVMADLIWQLCSASIGCAAAPHLCSDAADGQDQSGGSREGSTFVSDAQPQGRSDARRVKLILILEDDESGASIMTRLEHDSRSIACCSTRFRSERLARFSMAKCRRSQTPPACQSAGAPTYAPPLRERHKLERLLANDVEDTSITCPGSPAMG